MDNILKEIHFTATTTTVTSISEGVLDCVLFSDREDYVMAYIVDKNDAGLVYFMDYEGQSHYICRIPLTNKIKFLTMRNYLLVINSVSEQSDAFISVIDINSKHLLTSE